MIYVELSLRMLDTHHTETARLVASDAATLQNYLADMCNSPTTEMTVVVREEFEGIIQLPDYVPELDDLDEYCTGEPDPDYNPDADDDPSYNY